MEELGLADNVNKFIHRSEGVESLHIATHRAKNQSYLGRVHGGEVSDLQGCQHSWIRGPTQPERSSQTPRGPAALDLMAPPRASDGMHKIS
jgi:hypothetical protein